MTKMTIFLLYLAGINVLCFILMGLDKRFAKAKKRRIPEAVLLALAAVGGCAGEMIAMRLFHHKTLHAIFAVGLPIMTLAYSALLFALAIWL